MRVKPLGAYLHINLMTLVKTKNIAKNTAFLYIRMLLLMGVTFYTSRIILNALGVEDYGIYNVVGGVVSMFSFLTASFTASTQRFLNYEMGLGNREKLRRIFSMSIMINILISIFFVVVVELIGLWLIDNKLVIPPERLNAAYWVFQLSLIAAVITIMSSSYNALIIAHENMSVFAYISILEGGLKLSIAFIVVYYGSDKMTLYAFLVLLVSLIIQGVYLIYCKIKYQEGRYYMFWDFDLFKQMAGFAGWNLYGYFAFIMINQGLNMMLNIFFGPVVNASRAIAMQIQSAILGFASNFTIALNPQITQNYARDNRVAFLKLIFLSAKFSFFLLFIFTFPILVETKYILQIWLNQVPEYSVLFIRLVLIQLLIRILQNPLHTAMHATGRIRKYQLIDGTLLLLNIPIAYLLLCNGADAYVVFIISIVITFIALFVLLFILHEAIQFPIMSFVKEVLFPVFLVSLLILLINIPMLYLTETLAVFIKFIIRMFFAFSLSFLIIILIGLNKEEKNRLKVYKNKISLKLYFLKSRLFGSFDRF